MWQTDKIIEKAKKLGLDIDDSPHMADKIRSIAAQLGIEHVNTTNNSEIDNIEHILDEKIAEMESQVSEESSYDDYESTGNKYHARRNSVEDRPTKDERKKRKEELDEKVNKAQEEKRRGTKTIVKRGKNGETSSITKEKTGLDRVRDNINVARAKKDRFQNKIDNVTSGINDVFHPLQAMKRKGKNFAKKKIKDIGKDIAKGIKKGLKWLWNLIKTNKILMLIVIFIAIFLFILLIMFFFTAAGGGEGGNNKGLLEMLGFYDKECNFNESVVEYTGCFNSGEDAELSLDEFMIGTTYYYTKDATLSENQLRATMIVLKTNALSIGLYNNNSKTLKVSGCTMGYESNVPKSSYSKIEKIYKSIKEKLYLSEDYTGTIQSLNLFDSLDFDVEKFKGKSGGYETILNSIYKDKDLKIYDIKDNCTYYDPTDNNNFWWPIGGSTSNKGIYDGSPTVTYVSSGYGMRVIDGKEGFHSGIDIANRECEKHVIIAAKSGTITKSSDGCDSVGYYGNKCGGGYGNWVMIDHGDGTSTVYAHMTKNSIVVDEGDKVVQGQKIGTMGSSGSSTGCHLHFEVRVNNTRVNPADYISSSNPRPKSTYALSGVNDSASTASENKVEICKALLKSGYSENSVAGMMVNIQAEGSFLTNNLEGCYEENKCCKVNGRDYGFCVHPEIRGFGSDTLYTKGVDSGAYPRDKFINDRAGYGLIQWTSSGRKAGLYDYSKKNNKSIAALSIQLGYLLEELKSYPYTYKYITGNYSTYDIANNFCLDFERPANKESNCPARARNYSSSMLQFVKNGCSG